MLSIIKFFRCLSWSLAGFGLGAVLMLAFLVFVWNGIFGKLASDFVAWFGHHEVSAATSALEAVLVSIVYGGLIGTAISLICWLGFARPADD